MKSDGIGAGWASRLSRLGLAFLAAVATQGMAATEETFDLLEIGTRSYTNVTVTTKAKKYIFILHQAGMASIKVSELSPELRAQLGYTLAEKPKTNGVGSWAKQKVASLESPRIKQLQQTWRSHLPANLPDYRSVPSNILCGVLAGVLLLYLFFAYCCHLICVKTGNQPGVLVWIPMLQLLPLLRAAGMSPVWSLAFLVPVLNLLAQILWSVKIVQVRGKGIWLAILLMLPVTNLPAFLYLAFASGRVPDKKERAPEIMTLEAA